MKSATQNERYKKWPEICLNLNEPGLSLAVKSHVDYSQTASTLDQRRIEQKLLSLVTKKANILHVGIGNSSFAKNLSPCVEWIDGITVDENEVYVAESLLIQNYSVFLSNKYGRNLISMLPRHYDYIVDNNLASFACCRFHFFRMLDSYFGLLKMGGSILTDTGGMYWSVDPIFSLDVQDLFALEKVFPVKVFKLTQTVYSLSIV